MQARSLLLLSLGAVFQTAQFALAQDDVDVDVDVDVDNEELQAEDDEDAYDDALDEVHDIVTNYKILSSEDGRLPVGKPTTILVDFYNKGQDLFNVTHVAGFLHSPFDLNYYIQNFTVKPVSTGVAAPGSQLTLEYKITPDMALEPLEFWLSGFVEYTMEGSDELFRQHFVNTTIDLYDNKGIDITSTLMTMTLLSAIVGGLYYAGSEGVEKVTGKKMKKKFVPAKATDPAPEWEVKAYKASDRSRKAGSRNKKISKK